MLHLIWRVDICSCFRQQFYELQLAICCSKQKWRGAGLLERKTNAVSSQLLNTTKLHGLLLRTLLRILSAALAVR